MAGLEDLNIGGGVFTVTLPDGTTVSSYHQIGSHSFLNGLRTTVQNGCVGNGTADDRDALDTLANTTLIDGGIIYFAAPYTYRLSSSMSFPANVMLIFAPGSSLSLDSGVVVTMRGTIVAPRSAIFSGSGIVLYASGVTRDRKCTLLTGATSTTVYTYLPKPGDADITVVLPLFSTVRQIRLVKQDAHPTNGLTTTYTVKNSDGSTTFLTNTVTDGGVAAVVDYDATLALPRVQGVDATLLLHAAGTDTSAYRGWVEIIYD